MNLKLTFEDQIQKYEKNDIKKNQNYFFKIFETNHAYVRLKNINNKFDNNSLQLELNQFFDWSFDLPSLSSNHIKFINDNVIYNSSTKPSVERKGNQSDHNSINDIILNPGKLFEYNEDQDEDYNKHQNISIKNKQNKDQSDKIEIQMNYLLKQGTIGIEIATSVDFYFQSTGIISEKECSGDRDTHLPIMLTSFNDNYWILRTSFGKNWGQEGFVRFDMYSNVCNIYSDYNLSTSFKKENLTQVNENENENIYSIIESDHFNQVNSNTDQQPSKAEENILSYSED